MASESERIVELEEEAARRAKEPEMSDEQSDLSAKAYVGDVLSHVRLVVGTPRIVINAGYLGLCFLFLAAFVPVSPLDTSLQVAVYAFVVAIPLQVLALLAAVSEYKPGMDRRIEEEAKAMMKGMQIVCESLGPFAVYVGLGAVVWHLAGRDAVAVGVGVLVLAFLASLIVGRIVEVPNTRPPASAAAEAGSGQETPAQHNEQGEREQEPKTGG